MATNFAPHASVALELADGRREAQRLVQFEDRARIARDLHDHVIQQPFASGMTLQGAVIGPRRANVCRLAGRGLAEGLSAPIIDRWPYSGRSIGCSVDPGLRRRAMKRIQAAAAATLAVAMVWAVLVALAWDGSVRDHWMRTGIPGERDGGGHAMVAPRHMRSVGSNEYDYLAQMIAHHLEAIAAASELTRSDRAQMREFGISIATSQTAQVDQMTTWLNRWYPDRPELDASYLPEMRDLTGLSGDRLDHAFLTDMIGHHMMAVMASQQLLMMGTVEHDDVAELARTIRDEQHTEIVQMQSWLRAWFRAR